MHPWRRTGAWQRLILILWFFALAQCGSSEPAADPYALDWADTILVASFNIQNTGASKLGDSQVASGLVSIIRHFDIVALQEVRGTPDYVFTILVNALNEGEDGPYAFVSGEPVGSSGHLEQYGFIYDRTRVHHEPGDQETYPLTGLVRPPLLARFSTLGGLDFVLATVHVKPDEAQAEIDELVYVMKYGRDRFPSQKDVVVLGDFNADCSYFSEAGNASPFRSDAYHWVIGDHLDTNVAGSECTYDRIVIARAFTDEDYTGNHGVFRFNDVLGLNGTDTAAISDHFPVWFELTTTADTD
jgi:deoxyribonuclease-1-like protein